MRVFIAFPISERLQKEVEKYREFYPDLAVNWLEGKNLHITLIPPWSEEENNIDKIKEILKLLEGKTGSIAAVLNRVSYGPNFHSPRLIWATGKTPETFGGFKKSLERLLGKPGERNEFLLHLTLARFRPEDFQFFPVKKIDDEINWEETFNEFVMMRSHLSSGGADYEIMEKYKL